MENAIMFIKINLGVNAMNIDDINYEEMEIFNNDRDDKLQLYQQAKKPVTKINCQLEVTLKNNNNIVYVYKLLNQFFRFTALKCFGKGDIKIEGKDQWICNESGNFVLECPGFGIFQLKNGGILFIPDECLREDTKPKTKILTFKASSCGINSEFDVIFVFNPYKCIF